MSKITDRLFFAIRPDAPTVTQIEARRARLCAEQGLTGTLQKPAHFHITLHHLGDFTRFPQALVAQAAAAAATVAVPACEVVLDQAQSFSRREPRHLPCVLLAGEPLAPLKALHAALVSALKRAGLYRYAAFRPHLTLLHDNIQVERQTIEPLRWRATELLLVHSLLGRGEHVVLGHWPLR